MNKEDNNFGYFAKTVAEEVGIATDTLRSWSIKLEAEGVKFERNNRNQRVYYKHDMAALKNMKELMELQQPLNDVAKIISKKIEEKAYDVEKKENNDERTPSVSQGNNALVTQEERLPKVLENSILTITKEEFQEQQRQMFMDLLEQQQVAIVEKMQENQEEMINNAVKLAIAKERKKIAEEVINEMELMREVAASKSDEIKEKKSFWKKLFG